MKPKNTFQIILLLTLFSWGAALITCFILGLKEALICLAVFLTFLFIGSKINIIFPDADIPKDWLPSDNCQNEYEMKFRYLMAWPAMVITHLVSKKKKNDIDSYQ